MKDQGIDYGLGRTNIDYSTGIRYGVISQNEVLQAWADSSEANYGPPTCPKCGGEVVESDENKKYKGYKFYHDRPYDLGEYTCKHCKLHLFNEDVWNDEPLSFYYDQEGYEAECSDDGDIFILKSPYYTYCQFCSPCAPGAGYLMNKRDKENGIKAYCFGHDWFDDGQAPYDVYDVNTGELIESEE